MTAGSFLNTVKQKEKEDTRTQSLTLRENTLKTKSLDSGTKAFFCCQKISWITGKGPILVQQAPPKKKKISKALSKGA